MTDLPTLLAEALITNRDGIVGTWQNPAQTPNALPLNSPGNLERWSAAVRASIFDFEMFSRLGFSAAGSDMSIWHLKVTVPGGSGAPSVSYKALTRFIRPTKNNFKAQLKYLNDYADLREDRAAEIVAQLGTPEPFLGSIAFLHPDRTRWTLELLGAAFRLARFVEMRLKHGLACRRPNEYSPQVQPMIQTPAHGTLPSGHATEAFTLALVLWMLIRASGSSTYNEDAWGVQFLRLAARIAINRTVAGVHFPVDSAAGAVLGLTLGRYLVNRCQGKAKADAWKFDGTKFSGDFDWLDLYDVPAQAQKAQAYAIALAAPELGQESAALKWLWEKALAEWP